jgi:hypothetical protein
VLPALRQVEGTAEADWRMETMADDPASTPKLALDHAWQWFSLHAQQRMQTFNFFLAATAFLVAEYAAILEKLPLVALVVSIVGAWIAFWFTRLDNRTRQLIDAGEAVLRIYQEELARKTPLLKS